MNHYQFDRLKCGDQVLVEYPVYGYSVKGNKLSSIAGVGPWLCIIVKKGKDMIEAKHTVSNSEWDIGRYETCRTVNFICTRSQIISKVRIKNEA